MLIQLVKHEQQIIIVIPFMKLIHKIAIKKEICDASTETKVIAKAISWNHRWGETASSHW